MDPKSFSDQVAARLVEQLKSGTAPWQRRCEPGSGYLPFNPTNGTRYKGINLILLMGKGYDDPRWMTYKQAQAKGYQVRKGQKASQIQYWKFEIRRQPKHSDGSPILDERGMPCIEVIPLKRPHVFLAYVFNAAQIDGIPPYQKPEYAWDPIQEAERIVRASQADIAHDSLSDPYYDLLTDSIHLLSRERFQSAADYYATLLHELGHWTGHQSRLNRDMKNLYGSPGYACEELRAEIASLIIGSEIGIGYDPGQHAAYVGGWIKALQDEPLEIFRAAADAEKIQKYIYSLQQQQAIPEGISLADAIKEYERRVDGPESRKQLEKENPALVATRDRAVIALRKEQLQKELAAKSQALPLRF
jgi:putative DNA primase/helicase